ncbi:MAG: hypothetical protein H7245_15815 [Candidatus Saccharibacteria bacterium]|nr:hypothetical protein [Pseudorhodobacter sp.]
MNLSGNERLNFLCEGLAEDVSIGLGRFRSLFVIDRYSAAAVATATSDTVEIGKRLGAAVLVQGSIQVGASGLRVTVRLADSVTQTQICNDLFKWIQQALAADPDYQPAQAYLAFAEVVINN